MTTYDELAKLMTSIPILPKRELRCHPVVAVQLKLYTHTGEYTMADELTMLTGIPVYEVEDMYYGAWEIYEDGNLVAAGNTLPIGNISDA